MTGKDSISLSKVAHSGSPDEMACQAFQDSGDGRIDLFKAINFPADRTARTGQTLIIPHSKDMSQDTMSQLRTESVRSTQSQPVMSQAQTELHKSSWNVFEIASRYDGSQFKPSEVEIFTGMAGGYTEGIEISLTKIKSSLQGLNKLYSEKIPIGAGKGTARSVLMSKDFMITRAAYEADIKAQLSKINRNLSFQRNAGDNLRNTLGLGKSSVSVKAARGKDFLHKLSKAETRVSKSLSGIKLIGKSLSALNLATIGFDTVESYRSDGFAGGAKTLAVKSAGTAAGMKTGAVVGALIFGAGTGGIGYVVLGVAAIAASSFVASKGAEMVVEGMVEITNDQIDQILIQ